MMKLADRLLGMPLLENKVVTLPRPKGNLVLIVGAPGSGKSVATRLIREPVAHFTSDRFTEILLKHERSDSTNPDETFSAHSRTKDKFRKMRNNVLSSFRFDNVAFETLGINEEDMDFVISQARKRDMPVTAILVDVPLSVAQHGNQTRSRRVPAFVVSDTWNKVQGAFERLARLSDHAWVIQNHQAHGRPSHDDFRSGDLIRKVK